MYQNTIGKNNPKIIVNTRFLTQSITGVQRFAIEISRELKKYFGNDIAFVGPYNIINEEIVNELEVIRTGKHSGHIWEQIELPRYLNRHGKPLLVCLCNTAPIFYRHKISTVHDVAFITFPQTFSKSFLLFYRIIIPLVLKTSKKVVTVSNFSKCELQNYYHISADQIYVIYNAVDKSFKKVDDENLKKTPYFLAVSSVNYRKNFLAVLQAFQLLPNKDLMLYVVGDLKNNSFKGIDIQQYKCDTRIKFLGRVSDDELIRLYSNAVGFIYPSLYEGFGIPPIEAQMCGCPVLSSDIPVLKEVLQDSAYYCNPYDINDISEKMQQLCRDNYVIIMAGYENVKRFSWKQSSKILANVIKREL